MDKYHIPQIFDKESVIKSGKYKAVSEIKEVSAAMMQYYDSLKSLYAKYGEILQAIHHGRQSKGEEEEE
jgi:tRNA-dihydrouridine synthase